MTPEQRVEVYREQYWLRHLKNLDEDYPTVRWVLGTLSFHQLAREYLVERPPRTWDLQRLGADLPAFMAGQPRWNDRLLAVDAAALDWAFVEAFDAADAPPFDPLVLATTSDDAWSSALVVFHPSLRTLSLGYPVPELREAAQRAAPADEPRAALGELPRAEATHVVVARDGRCYLKATVIDPSAFRLLEALRLGARLGDACVAIAGASEGGLPELGEQVSRWFQQWTASGWVSAVRLDDSTPR
jgi:hypothetical protein